MAEHRIPPMTDPLGRHWSQPSRHEILDVNDDSDSVTMSRTAFLQLKDYSHSIPTGVYIGKMWRCKARPGWRLKWYDRVKGEFMEIESRVIRVTMTDIEFARVVIEWAREWLTHSRSRHSRN